MLGMGESCRCRHSRDPAVKSPSTCRPRARRCAAGPSAGSVLLPCPTSRARPPPALPAAAVSGFTHKLTGHLPTGEGGVCSIRRAHSGSRLTPSTWKAAAVPAWCALGGNTGLPASLQQVGPAVPPLTYGETEARSGDSGSRSRQVAGAGPAAQPGHWAGDLLGGEGRAVPPGAFSRC